MQEWIVTITIHAMGEDEEAVRERIALELSAQALNYDVTTVETYGQWRRETV
jgi:hypothetical protein